MVKESGYPSIQALAADYGAGVTIWSVATAAGWWAGAVAMIAYILAPEAILIGGSVGLLGARYLHVVAATLRRHTLPSHWGIELLFTALGPDSGLIWRGVAGDRRVTWTHHRIHSIMKITAQERPPDQRVHFLLGARVP